MAYDLNTFSFFKICILFFPLNFRDYLLVFYEPKVLLRFNLFFGVKILILKWCLIHMLKMLVDW